MNQLLLSTFALSVCFIACIDGGASSTGSGLGGSGAYGGGGGYGGEGAGYYAGSLDGSLLSAGGSDGYNCPDVVILDLIPLKLESGQGLCTAVQIDEFLDACLNPASATTHSCTSYQTMNGPCADCMWVSPEATIAPITHPALVPVGQYLLVNTVACEAVAQAKPACAGSALEYEFCKPYACFDCEAADFDACLTEAEDTCSGHYPSEECVSLLPETGAASPECGGQTEDFEPLLKAVGLFLCGSPTP